MHVWLPNRHLVLNAENRVTSHYDVKRLGRYGSAQRLQSFSTHVFWSCLSNRNVCQNLNRDIVSNLSIRMYCAVRIDAEIRDSSEKEHWRSDYILPFSLGSYGWLTYQNLSNYIVLAKAHEYIMPLTANPASHRSNFYLAVLWDIRFPQTKFGSDFPAAYD